MQPLDARTSCLQLRPRGREQALQWTLRRCKRNHGTGMRTQAFYLPRRKSGAIAALLAQLDARESAPVNSSVRVRRQLSFCAD